jgi:hypothetical protein
MEEKKERENDEHDIQCKYCCHSVEWNRPLLLSCLQVLSHYFSLMANVTTMKQERGKNMPYYSVTSSSTMLT